MEKLDKYEKELLAWSPKLSFNEKYEKYKKIYSILNKTSDPLTIRKLLLDGYTKDDIKAVLEVVDKKKFKLKITPKSKLQFLILIITIIFGIFYNVLFILIAILILVQMLIINQLMVQKKHIPQIIQRVGYSSDFDSDAGTGEVNPPKYIMLTPSLTIFLLFLIAGIIALFFEDGSFFITSLILSVAALYSFDEEF